MGVGGSGGPGGSGGYIYESVSPPAPGKKGGAGQPGGPGGAGGNGGAGEWIINAAVVINDGEILLGGYRGEDGAEGDTGFRGGLGGNGDSLKLTILPPFLEPAFKAGWDGHPSQHCFGYFFLDPPENYDCPPAWRDKPGHPGEGGKSSLTIVLLGEIDAAEDGKSGVFGGGGGGGGANDVLLPFFAAGSGGDGGNGLPGLGGTGAVGPNGSDTSIVTNAAFLNTGNIQLGGNGGDRGAGGDGGNGGGGGGGAGADIWFSGSWSTEDLAGGVRGIGGDGGAGGQGGAGGSGGDGTIEIRAGGLLINSNTGNLLLGSVSVGQNARGLLHVASGSTLENEGSIVVRNGGLTTSPTSTLINNGDITVPDHLSNQGEMRGNGTLIGDLQNHGNLSPGSSPGSMAINGDYSENGALLIELGGFDFYDYLDVSGDVYLDHASVLELRFFDSFGESGLGTASHFDIVRYSGDLHGSFGQVDSTAAPLRNGSWGLEYHHVVGNGQKSIRLSYSGNPPVPLSKAMLLILALLLTALAWRSLNTRTRS